MVNIDFLSYGGKYNVNNTIGSQIYRTIFSVVCLMQIHEKEYLFFPLNIALRKAYLFYYNVVFKLTRVKYFTVLLKKNDC